MQRSQLVFEASINSEATKGQYLYQLRKFREWAKIKDFDSLLEGPHQTIQIMLEDYVMYLRKKVKSNSVPTYFAPIELFFTMNDVTINYKKLRRLFPKKTKKGNERAYTRKEIQAMLDYAKTKRSKALVLLFACSGGRLGAIAGMQMKHISQIEDSFAIKIYEDDIMEDYVFTTPEATISLEEYFEERRRDGEYMSPESPVIRTAYRIGVEVAKPCNTDSLGHIMSRIVKCIPRKKKGNRYEVAKDHGFRKWFATIIKDTPGITPTMTEKLINHIGIVQLDGAYYTPSMEKMFAAFKLAIPELTISDTIRLQEENRKLEAEKSEIDSIKAQMDRMQVQIERQEKYSKSTS